MLSQKEGRPCSCIFEVTTQQIKVQRVVRYCCHICGDIGHKITNSPMYNDMQNMFNNK
jgi:hypothetical protein